MAAAVKARAGLGWSDLPRAAQLHVAAVISAGTVVAIALFPRAFPRPGLFFFAILAACITSTWKVNLPISLASGSTLSVSYAADLMALLLLGPGPAMVVAIAGVLAQCTINVKQPYPFYRTAFSMAAEALTVAATGAVYVALGGTQGAFDFEALPKALLGAIATYFLVNTGLVAAAIALSRRDSFLHVWREDFLWSSVSYVVAGTAGATAAIVIDQGRHWKTLLMFAPVYLTYRTYQIFMGRLDDQRRHVTEMEKTLAEMKKLEQTRNELLEREQAARASAEQANQLKDQFLAIVSHELRTPLNAILGWSDMLLQGMLEEDRRGRAHQVIYDSAIRQARLIDELLDVARIVSGKLRLERARVDAAEIVHAAIEVVRPAANEKHINIVVDVDPEAGAFYGDGARFQQVAWNILTNGVKFTPQGGSLHVSLRRAGTSIVLAVTDTGPGIPAEFLPSVFEPFRQADQSTTRTHGGLGLGLSIVKHLVEAHGGTITATSKGEGHGSTFTVALPALPASDAESSSERRGARAAAFPARSLADIAVLVVDDDDESRAVVATYLKAHHAAVVTASSAREAFEVLMRERIDVLLADIAMPDEDGYQFIRRLRGSGSSALRRMPAAALTAFARDEDRHQALKAGFHLHLAKPVDARLLVDAVAALASRSALPAVAR